MIPEKNIERLILYRKILKKMKENDKSSVFSHSLAEAAGCSSAQVRRDLMVIGYHGSPAHGYKIQELMDSISHFLDMPQGVNTVLVGLGNLGRAILDYCYGQHTNIKIVAAFDNDMNKVNRVLHGCRCYHTDDMKKVIEEKKVLVAILSIPPDEAQNVAEKLLEYGIKGILNYSPVNLNLPENIYIENRDMLTALEKVAYFARNIES